MASFRPVGAFWLPPRALVRTLVHACRASAPPPSSGSMRTCGGRNRHRQRPPDFRDGRTPPGAVKEARRVSAALANTGYTFPLKRVNDHSGTATSRKKARVRSSSRSGILAATEQVVENGGKDRVLGELGLEGRDSPGPGSPPVALAARRPAWRRSSAAREPSRSRCRDGLQVLGAGCLAEKRISSTAELSSRAAAVDVARLFAERARMM